MIAKFFYQQDYLVWGCKISNANYIYFMRFKNRSRIAKGNSNELFAFVNVDFD